MSTEIIVKVTDNDQYLIETNDYKVRLEFHRAKETIKLIFEAGPNGQTEAKVMIKNYTDDVFSFQNLHDYVHELPDITEFPYIIELMNQIVGATSCCVFLENGKRLEPHLFSDLSQLKNVVLDANNLSEGLFSGCERLEEVTFKQEKVLSIGKDVFFDCVSLNSIHHEGEIYPSGVISINTDYIGPSAFENCINIQKVLLQGDQLKCIGDQAFYSCEKLSSIEHPSSLMKVGQYCFYGCGFTEYKLRSNIEWGQFCFENNKGLVLVIILSGDDLIPKTDLIDMINRKKLFQGCFGRESDQTDENCMKYLKFFDHHLYSAEVQKMWLVLLKYLPYDKLATGINELHIYHVRCFTSMHQAKHEMLKIDSGILSLYDFLKLLQAQTMSNKLKLHATLTYYCMVYTLFNHMNIYDSWYRINDMEGLIRQAKHICRLLSYHQPLHPLKDLFSTILNASEHNQYPCASSVPFKKIAELLMNDHVRIPSLRGNKHEKISTLIDLINHKIQYLESTMCDIENSLLAWHLKMYDTNNPVPFPVSTVIQEALEGLVTFSKKLKQSSDGQNYIDESGNIYLRRPAQHLDHVFNVMGVMRDLIRMVDIDNCVMVVQVDERSKNGLEQSDYQVFVKNLAALRKLYEYFQLFISSSPIQKLVEKESRKLIIDFDLDDLGCVDWTNRLQEFCPTDQYPKTKDKCRMNHDLFVVCKRVSKMDSRNLSQNHYTLQAEHWIAAMEKDQNTIYVLPIHARCDIRQLETKYGEMKGLTVFDFFEFFPAAPFELKEFIKSCKSYLTKHMNMFLQECTGLPGLNVTMCRSNQKTYCVRRLFTCVSGIHELPVGGSQAELSKEKKLYSKLDALSEGITRLQAIYRKLLFFLSPNDVELFDIRKMSAISSFCNKSIKHVRLCVWRNMVRKLEVFHGKLKDDIFFQVFYRSYKFSRFREAANNYDNRDRNASIRLLKNTLVELQNELKVAGCKLKKCKYAYFVMDDLSKLSRGQSMEKIESELASFLDHTKQVQDVLVEPNVRLCCQGLFAPSACSSIPNSTVSQKCLV